jgi:predicted acyltransferase (DUF342 family)
LVAVGKAGGKEVIREAIVQQTEFPWSIASKGSVSGKDITVYSVNSFEDIQDGAITDDEKFPGHILSTLAATGPDPSVLLGGATEVKGDVESGGSISLVGGAQVLGKQLENSTDAKLSINRTAKSYDPTSGGQSLLYTPSTKKISGHYDYTGDLTIGDLTFADGMLYVKGNVTVTGDVSGIGALVAEGDITVTGSMETEADHAALVAKGDIKIHGDGPNSSKFYGLVYSEGSIDIARTTIMGAAVSKDTAGTTKLEDVVAVAVPELTVMDLEQHLTLGEIPDVNWGDTPLVVLGSNGEHTRLSPGADIAELQALGEALGNNDPDGKTWEVVVQTSTGFEPISSLPVRDRRDALKAEGYWRDYVLEHKNNAVKTIEIFDLDLNTLISLDVELEMMFHQTVQAEVKN